MTTENKNLVLTVFCIIVATASFTHVVRSMYLTSVWSDCLGRTEYLGDARINIIDKCAVVTFGATK